MNRPRRRLLSIVPLALLCAYGLYASAKITLENFGMEPDAAHSLMLWFAAQDQGLNALSTWRYTQDNWLLSLIPLHFAMFALVGPSTLVPIVFGWVIFVASAVVAALIARKLGAGWHAWLVLIVLLNLGLYAHLFGYASYSTTHNVTNLYGLGSVLALVHWLSRPRPWLLAVLLLLLTAGALSDPWLLASYCVPLVLAGLVGCARPTATTSRAQHLQLVAVAAFSVIATKTQLFGLLAFLPAVHFMPGWPGRSFANALFCIRDAGALLALVPGVRPDALVAASLSLLAVLAFMATRVKALVDRGAFFGRIPVVFASFAILSVGAICAAIVVSGVEADALTGRFELNIVYLTVVAVAVLAADDDRRAAAAHRAAAALCGLFLLTAIASTAPTVVRPGWRLKDTGVGDMVELLRREGLTYGYGTYWGSLSNAVTAATGQAIRVRPVMFSRKTGRLQTTRFESLAGWFVPADVPPGTRNFFVALKEDEDCIDASSCVADATARFGAPDRTIEKNGLFILVWNHPLPAASP